MAWKPYPFQQHIPVQPIYGSIPRAFEPIVQNTQNYHLFNFSWKVEAIGATVYANFWNGTE